MSLNLGLGFGINLMNSFRRLLSYYWTDHSGNNLVDHNGNKIEFRP